MYCCLGWLWRTQGHRDNALSIDASRPSWRKQSRDFLGLLPFSGPCSSEAPGDAVAHLAHKRCLLPDKKIRFCRKFSFEAICAMISLHDQRDTMRERAMAISFKGAHFPPAVMLMGVRWYVAYPLSTRQVEALLEDCGGHVDHSTINRWGIKDSPQLAEAFHRR